MKQTLSSPIKAKKWAGLSALAVVMVLLFRTRLTNFTGTLLTFGVIVLFIDMLVNGVLAEYEYQLIDGVFVYKRKFRNREKILFFLPLDSIITVAKEGDPTLSQYEIRSTNNVIPRFCDEEKYVAIYREHDSYYRFLLIPNEEFLTAFKEQINKA